MHEGCPEGGTWIRRLTDEQVTERVHRACHLADELWTVLDTLRGDSDRLPPERQTLIEQAQAQADGLCVLTEAIKGR
ncbi:MAG: hypothetical protein KDJ99_31935 [Candidatus Competibacteraceae bacterium]|nr:hypothetical protein [Candidatus Competibacteraceae bacterium]